ncbi:MAG TPA: hypothetical protein VGS07_16755 [Thermoanaerobaculia bacterium]|jgi:hypothetical protein|nr:hypothetical protein [Thermoanaerobaculia bacterium]
MKSAVVNFPEDLKADLERLARHEGRSEEDLILEGVRHVVQAHASPAPRIPLFFSDDPTLARSTDELLRGFGER